MREKEIKELYLAGDSTVSLAKKFGSDSKTIWQILKDASVKMRSQSDSVKLALEKGRLIVRQHNIPNKGLTIEKAYLLGILCGDGWIWCNKCPPHQTYQFGLQTVDEDFIDEFRRCVYKAYGLKASKYLRKRKQPWQAIFESRICSKAVCEDIKHFLPDHKTRTWHVPGKIKIANLKTKAAFIKGFFDSEGHVDVRRIGATSINLRGLGEMVALLQKFGIRTKIQHRKNHAYVLIIQDRKSIEIYTNHIGFIIRRKSLALSKVLDSYVLWKYLEEDVRILEPEINRLRKEGETYREISKKLGLSMGTVWRHSKI